MQTKLIIQTTQSWINSFVISLNLCPFATAEIKHNTVHFEVSSTESHAQLLQHLQIELTRLKQHPEIETTLLIHPNTLTDFTAYNEFLDRCDELIIDMQLEGVYQIASFHPEYQFADTHINDAENYSNKSPYPMLHILREASLERAIQSYPNSDEIPQRNIQTLKALGADTCRSKFKDCFQ